MIGWDYDQSFNTSYRFARKYLMNKTAGQKLWKGKDNKVHQLADELEGVMRSIRKLSPKQEDNFIK